MAEYSTSFDKSGGYAFDERAVADLWKQAQSFTGKTTEISATLEGSHNIRAAAIDEFFDDAFVKNNFIESISISSHRYDQTPSKSISILLRKDTLLDSIRVSISGDRTDCSAKLAEISAIIDGRRLWYAPYLFSRSYWSATVWGILTAILGGIVSNRVEKYTGKELSLFLSWLVFAGVAVFLLMVATFLKRQMFPKIIFEIGKSAYCGESAGYWRNVIGVGVVLALVVGIVGGLVVEWMK